MKVITSVVNNPTFIYIQWLTLKKYFTSEYEFIVFNDAKSYPDHSNFQDPTLKQQIIDICNKLNIQCINLPNEERHKKVTNTSLRCADSMNFMLQYELEHPDKYLCLDSDMFLIDYFDPKKYDGYEAAIVPQFRMVKNKRVDYFLNGVYYFDTTIISNKHLLNWNVTEGTDVGGSMAEWLLLAPKIYVINHLSSLQWNEQQLPEQYACYKDFLSTDPRNIDGKYYCELYDGLYLHYRAGSAWMHSSAQLHANLTQKLLSVVKSFFDKNVEFLSSNEDNNSTKSKLTHRDVINKQKKKR